MARHRIRKKKKKVNKAKRINTLATDMKKLLELDGCDPVLLDGRLWLRMASGAVALDCPVSLEILLDPQHDHTNSIKQSVIKVWIAHIQHIMRGHNGS